MRQQADYLALVQDTILDAEKSISVQVSIIKKLSEAASGHPYYKYNGMWTRDIQDVVSVVKPCSWQNKTHTSGQVFSIILCGWLGGFKNIQGEAQSLLQIESVGQILNGKRPVRTEVALCSRSTVPVNLKDRDEFHLTIEEYLHALISLIEELVLTRIPTPVLS